MPGKAPTILAIESSCDDTSAAVVQAGELLSNETANQSVHEAYGGVVPELASRAHQQNIVPVVEAALRQAAVGKHELDAIAVTRGPGLLGPLLVGLSFAKSFAQALDLPLIEVNHMQAHILAHFIEEPKPPFPFLCLTVSGGHTQIVQVNSPHAFKELGSTRDDAAGEAFDKAGKILGLGYPAGAQIDKLGQKGDPKAFPFPIAKVPDFDFSFSGLKTSVLYFARDKENESPGFVAQHLPNICASLQDTIARTLLKKLEKAAKATGIQHLAIAGGVSANSALRHGLESLAKKHRWRAYIPAFAYCTDNAGMIAMAAHFKYLQGDMAKDYRLSPDPRMKV